MKTLRFVRKLFFILTIKSPAVVLLIIALTIAGLLYISCTSYTGIYLKADGMVLTDPASSESSYVIVKLDNSYAGKINAQSPVIWYCDNKGQRYVGHIGRILEDADNKSLSVHVILSGSDMEREHPQKVSVELQVKKVRIIDKLALKAVTE